jgi:CheY-like chemotaxis protein
MKKKLQLVLVDHEPKPRAILRALFEEAGWSVIEAGSGLEALFFCARRQSPVDLLLSRQDLPGIGGTQLGAKFSHGFPGVPVISYPANGAPQELLAAARAAMENAAQRKAPGSAGRRVAESKSA